MTIWPHWLVCSVTFWLLLKQHAATRVISQSQSAVKAVGLINTTHIVGESIHSYTLFSLVVYKCWLAALECAAHPTYTLTDSRPYYLRRRRRLCFRCGLFVCLSVCLFVCLSVGLLANLWTDFDEIFWRGRAWLKDFGSGSPKSEIRILLIGGGLFSVSAFLFL